MRALTIILLVTSLGSVSDLASRFMLETNSARASREGIEAYQAERYREAVEAFETASRIDATGRTAFDLGTALVANGDHATGMDILGDALEEPDLTAAAHYNRGNAALATDDLEAAIAEYIDSLRIDPSDRRAKRNLEIAMNRKQQQEQRQSPEEGDDGEGENETPRVGENEPSDELEALLRSVEQQEREELKRMRQAREGRVPVGW